MLIFKVLTVAQSAAFEREGLLEGAPVDLADGYIHFSTGAQLEGTLSRHFAQEGDLVLAAVDAEAVADALRWEPARDGDLFPHLYRPLRLAEALWTKKLPRGPAGHAIPPEALA